MANRPEKARGKGDNLRLEGKLDMTVPDSINRKNISVGGGGRRDRENRRADTLKMEGQFERHTSRTDHHGYNGKDGGRRDRENRRGDTLKMEGQFERHTSRTDHHAYNGRDGGRRDRENKRGDTLKMEGDFQRHTSRTDHKVYNGQVRKSFP